MFKNVNLLFEESNFDIGYDTDTTLVSFSVNDFCLDEKESKPDHKVYKVHEKLEVYLEAEELKELARTLLTLIPEEEF